MANDVARYWPIIASLLGIASLLIRMIMQLGMLIESFRKHVKDSDDRFNNHDKRLTWLEHRKRGW